MVTAIRFCSAFAISALIPFWVVTNASCSEPRRAPRPFLPVVTVTAVPDAMVALVRFDSMALEPGNLHAFGLAMPVGSVERLVTDGSRIYSVEASVPRVMRYLERRVQVTQGDIHPLSAMIRGARVHAPLGGESFILDVAVRADGDRTIVTLWNLTAVVTPPRTADEGLRAAGIDPRTGGLLPQNNY